MTTLSLLSWLFEATLKGSVVIAMVALAVSLFGSRLGARWRHALWLIVLIRLAVPFAPASTWSIFNLFPSPKIASHEAQFQLTAESAEPVVLRDHTIRVEPTWWGRYGSLVLSIWAAGALLVLMRLLVASRRLQVSVRHAESSRDREAELRLAPVIEDARRQLRMKQPVEVIVAPTVRSPALQGIVRPKLLLPEMVARSFGHREVRHIVLHELWHLRRQDVAVNWVLSLIEAVHWFNPLVWFAVARIREEREICCDELALSCLEEEERIGYGGTILRLLEEFRTAAAVPAMVGIVNHKQLMKRRLTMIASYPSRKRSSALYIGLVALVGAVAFTDANGGEGHRVMMRKIHPGSHEQMSKLHGRTSLNLTAASFGDLINAVSSTAGVTITQAPAVATSKIQNARFTIDAQNVPVHMVLMHALAPFELSAQPTESGISIEEGVDCGPEKMVKRKILLDGAEPAKEGEKRAFRVIVDEEAKVEGAAKEKKRFRIMHKDASAASAEQDVVIMRHGAEGEGGEVKHVMVHATGDGAKSCQLDENGNLHQELKVKLTENGVESEGSLKIDISTK